MSAHRRTFFARLAARLRRPAAGRTEPRALFTVSAFLNTATAPAALTGQNPRYRPGDTLARVMDPDRPGRPMEFAIVAPDAPAAAAEALRIGRSLTTDNNGVCWPGQLRHLAAGDAVAVAPLAPAAGARRFWALEPGDPLVLVELGNGGLALPPAPPAPTV